MHYEGVHELGADKLQMKGLDQFKHPSFNALPSVFRGAVKAGWYEGSVFFTIMGPSSFPSCNLTTFIDVTAGIMNYKWAQTGIYDIYDKSIAALILSLLAGAGAAYYKSGDRPTAATLAVVAIVQGLGVRSGSYSRLV
jgi:hypothetical protein